MSWVYDLCKSDAMGLAKQEVHVRLRSDQSALAPT
jgi:hypothetical protein